MELIRNAQWRIGNALRRLIAEAGQTTAEYALVLLAAAAIALVLINWASGENSALTDFFDGVVGKLGEMAGFGGPGD
jgi:Flp pilus assembly pilin Flp